MNRASPLLSVRSFHCMLLGVSFRSVSHILTRHVSFRRQGLTVETLLELGGLNSNQVPAVAERHFC